MSARPQSHEEEQLEPLGCSAVTLDQETECNQMERAVPDEQQARANVSHAGPGSGAHLGGDLYTPRSRPTPSAAAKRFPQSDKQLLSAAE
ncbi:hypothetical protein SKAU_G00374620 [Synaphobranchus kaupii]|uniref:Uncharacterized protein n=1 Tax=Synaphobranchus kaupii TaxID=118154 RepID=A0A9Q1EGQ7_SYNKA|nr:hypothetical protein SKAU_G00374620 [Synaphobranchus kaupii]